MDASITKAKTCRDATEGGDVRLLELTHRWTAGSACACLIDRASSKTELRLPEGWWEFLISMPQRNVHGLQTFHLADMDYRGFTDQVPGMLAAPLVVAVGSGPQRRGASTGCVSTRPLARRQRGRRNCSVGSLGGMWDRWGTSDCQRCSCG